MGETKLHARGRVFKASNLFFLSHCEVLSIHVFDPLTRQRGSLLNMVVIDDKPLMTKVEVITYQEKKGK